MELPKPAILVLALVEERPLGAYEMIKVLEKVNLRRWLPVSDATMYLTVKNLARRGLIAGRSVREGNMPEKVVYTLTPAGGTALREELVRCLGTGEAAGAGFDLATLFLCHLERAQAARLLSERRGRLSGEIERARGRLAALEADTRVPFIGRRLVRNNLYRKEAELRTTAELLAEVEAAERWDCFVSRDFGPAG